jgi:hypothetical protein
MLKQEIILQATILHSHFLNIRELNVGLKPKSISRMLIQVQKIK